MRKVLLLLVIALLSGCQERLMSPHDEVKLEKDVEYGATAVRLPGLKGLGKGLIKANCRFELTISGKNMSDMVFSYQLGELDTMVVIEKIPAGPARKFKGILRQKKIITHEGSAEARIRPGKVTFVKLYLRAAGSAEVEVIIDGGTPSVPLEGCMKLEGVIEGQPLDELSIEILEATENEFWTYIKRNGEFVGKFWGTISDHYFEGEFGLDIGTIPYWVVGHFNDDWSAFKSTVFGYNDTSEVVGIMEGYSIDCNDIPGPPQTCFTDTVNLQAGCISEGALAAICLERCIDKQLRPQSFYFTNSCSNGEYEAIVFDYCVFNGSEQYCYSDSIDAPEGCLPEEMMMQLLLEYCVDNKVFPGRFDLVEPCTGEYGEGFSRIIFDYCSEDPINPPPPPPPSKCYGIDGVIYEDTLFGEVYMRMLEFNRKSFLAELYRSGTLAGIFFGNFYNNNFEYTGFFRLDADSVIVKGVFADEAEMFKGSVFAVNDTTHPIGYIDGYTVDCSEIGNDDPPPVPPITGCFELSGNLDTSSLDGVISYTKGYDNGNFDASLAKEGVYAGYIFGFADEKIISGNMVYETDTAMVMGTFSPEGDAFKAVLYSHIDTTVAIGTLVGEKVTCPDIIYD